MQKSESIKELAAALSKAQAVIEGAMKDKTNPAFRSKYADLGNCWDAARKPLTDNGFAVIQPARLTELGVEVETMLVHASGEYVSETLTIPLSKRDAHGVGSAITYGRRFGLCAMVGISPEDDDGNHGAGKGKNGQQEDEPAPGKATPRGSAREVTKEAYEALNASAKEALQRKAQHVQEVYAAKGIVDAVNTYHDLMLDTEGKLAIWFLFDSEFRSNIKREEARRRENAQVEAEPV